MKSKKISTFSMCLATAFFCSGTHALSIQIDHIEVNQSVQYADNSIPLVAGKEGAVRVYLKGLDGAVKDIRGTLLISWNGGSLTKSSSNWIDLDPEPLTGEWQQQINKVTERQKRLENDIKATLNFIIPNNEFPVQNATFLIESITDSTKKIKCTNCKTEKVGPLTIYKVKPVMVRLIGFQAFGIQPRPEDVSFIKSWLKRAYPVSDLRVEYDVRKLEVFNNQGISSFNDWKNITAKWEILNYQIVNVILTKYAEKQKDSDEQLLKSGYKVLYYGLVPDQIYPMTGGESSTPIASVASGPSGPTNEEMEKTNQLGYWTRKKVFSDIYASHEIAHMFGGKHVGKCRGVKAVDVNYPDKDGLISDTKTGKELIGLDVGDAQNGFSTTVYSAKDTYDLLSYCDNVWISPYTYNSILDQIKETTVTLAKNSTLAFSDSFPQINFGISSAHADNITAHVRVLGTINPTDKASILEVYPISDTQIINPPTSQNSNEAEIRFCQANDCSLPDSHAITFSVPWYPSSNSTQQEPEGLAITALEIPKTVVRAELLFNGKLVASTSVGQTLPKQISITDKSGPSTDGTVGFEWEPQGEQIGNVLYDVDISRDNGVWEPVTISTKRTFIRVGSDILKNAKSIRFRVRAVNGLEQVEIISNEIQLN